MKELISIFYSLQFYNFLNHSTLCKNLISSNKRLCKLNYLVTIRLWSRNGIEVTSHWCCKIYHYN